MVLARVLACFVPPRNRYRSMNPPILRTGWPMILEGTVMVLAGLMLALVPLQFLKALATVAGIFLLIAGAIGMFREVRDPRRAPYSFGIAGPALTLLLGVLLIAWPLLVPSLLVTILGVFLLLIGLSLLLFGFAVGRGPRGTSLKLTGVTGIALGILVMVFTEAAIWLFALFFAAMLVVNGLMAISLGWRLNQRRID